MRPDLPSFQGEFESHITFALTEPAQWDSLASWCGVQGLKCVHILLDRGASASQPMATRHGVGTLESELHKAHELQREGEAAGFAVSRVKLEVSPHNDAVPPTQAEADLSGQCYFEYHIKLLLPSQADLEALKDAIAPHQAHLSRNARRLRDNGQQERFVTQRSYHVGRVEALHSFEQLRLALAALGFLILESEAEYVVYDSNIALDAGWLEAGAACKGAKQ